MEIIHYNPTPKGSEKEFYHLRDEFYEKASEQRVFSNFSGGFILHINKTTVIVRNPDFLAYPLVKIGGEKGDIISTKSGLETLTGIKLRKTKKK